MATLVSLTVEKMGNQVYTTPETFQFDPLHIKFVQPEDSDFFNDRAMIQYYDNQKKILLPVVVSEAPDAVETAVNATATDPILYQKVVSTFNRKFLGKLCLLNNYDGIVITFPVVADKPNKAFYDMGERNHMKHAELQYCDLPLEVIEVNITENSILLACCVDHFMICGTSITVEGNPFTVLASFCDSMGGTLVLDGDVSGIVVGDDVEIT